MKNRVFITGINTEVGKTIVSAILCKAMGADYWKPIQCGELEYTDSDKVRDLANLHSENVHNEQFRLNASQSPHYAAQLENVTIKLSDFQMPTTQKLLIIEGAGGICVPINEKEYFIDGFPKSTPIVLVSKHELGSINATILSLEYLKKNGFTKIGIVYNGDPKPSTEDIINSKEYAFVIGRIDKADNINPQYIEKQATKLKSKINEFLQSD